MYTHTRTHARMYTRTHMRNSLHLKSISVLQNKHSHTHTRTCVSSYTTYATVQHKRKARTHTHTPFIVLQNTITFSYTRLLAHTPNKHINTATPSSVHTHVHVHSLRQNIVLTISFSHTHSEKTRPNKATRLTPFTFLSLPLRVPAKATVLPR